MFSNLSVKYKVTLIAVLTSTIVVILAAVAFLALEIGNYRRAMVQELTTVAQIIANNSTAALTFEDRNDAEEVLSALKSKSNILAGELFINAAKAFARYRPKKHTDGLSKEPWDHNRITRVLGSSHEISSNGFQIVWRPDRVDLYGPVVLEGETIGAIVLRSDLEEIYATVGSSLWISLSIIAFAISLALLLASLLHGQITRPISGLIQTLNNVAGERDYSKRAEKFGDDELGRLIDNVNSMLAQTELHETELSAARENAESANRMKSEFLAHMSHELRTPLNAILGFSDVVLSEAFGPLGHENYKDYVGDIRDSGGHLLDVINDILDLSKVEAGCLDLVEEELDTTATIHTAVRLMRERMSNAGIAYEEKIDCALPHLQADERILKQCLMNLLSNAVKFTPEGGQMIVEAKVLEQGAVAISVSDSGIGIAQQDIKTVLSAFGQAENVMSRKHNGTGLGLPLVKSFMELHGGRLELTSALGAGTTVTLWFPASRNLSLAREDSASPLTALAS